MSKHVRLGHGLKTGDATFVLTCRGFEGSPKPERQLMGVAAEFHPGVAARFVCVCVCVGGVGSGLFLEYMCRCYGVVVWS